MDVVVTDHHRRAPTARCRTPDRAPGAVRLPVRRAVRDRRRVQARAGAAARPPGAIRASSSDDLDLVALATVADLVPLRGENRTLVRARPAGARRDGQARAARADARRAASTERASTSARSASRSRRASTPPGACTAPTPALELLLTEDAERAAEIARELDAVNRERRAVEPRILLEAEAQIAAARRSGGRPTCSPARAGTRA